MNTIKYQDLPEDRKEQIRNKHREAGLHDDWWEYVYEDAKEIGKQFGLDIEDIFFSGFWSQGDGACYKGSLRFKECEERDLPEEVRGIYRTLHGVRVLLDIVTPDISWRVLVTHGGSYVHEHTMQIDTNISADIDDPIGGEGTALETILKETEEDVAEALRDYARWIYKNLEREHEYLNSDECIDEQLYDEEYDDEQETIGQDKYRIQ
jgi:hypothetical protein